MSASDCSNEKVGTALKLILAKYDFFSVFFYKDFKIRNHANDK